MIDILGFFMNLDKNLVLIVHHYGFLSYFLLFFIIFIETGLFFTPFLPGDSLIFAAGAIAAVGSFDILFLFLFLSLAAILGDTANYFIGKYIGAAVLRRGYVKQKYIDKTQSFYRKYGGKTIIIARFIPIVRTFAPFVAGIGRMNYTRFLGFNVIGGTVWVALFSFAGFFFGNIPLVKNNFSMAILVIIFLSILPAVIEYIRHRLRKKG